MQESTCTAGAFCEIGEVCGTDEQCRVSCTTAGGCTKGDYCVTTGTVGACYSASTSADQSTLIAAGVLASDGAVIGDASVVVVDGSAGSSGGGPQDGSGSSSGSSGGDGPTNSCPSAQTQFGFTAHGDANANFTSGVGLRTASGMLVFSGYAGPATSGYAASDGGATVNLVYVQSFDPGQGTTTSQAQPLFQAPAGTNFFVYGAAIAPTGQIALVYGYNDCCTTPNLPFFDYNTYPQGNESFYGAGIYATFLDSSPDAGSAGVAFARTVPLETGEYLGQPHVIWSAASQSFVFSWHSRPTNASGVPVGQGVATVQKFLVTGAAAGGDTDVVPTNDSTGEIVGYNYDQAALGVSGNLFGVVYVTGAPNGVGGAELGYPFLTLLDAQGSLVGSTIQISSNDTSPNWITIAGTAQGFVYLYDINTGVRGAFIPVSGGAAVLPVDGGAGFQPIAINGAIEATSAYALADDDTAAGGVGVALLYLNGVSFAYVNPDGSVKLQPNRVFAHTYVVSDEYSVGVFGGSFALALYDSVAHSTQIAASGCQ